MPDDQVLHRTLVKLASWAVWSFFTEVHIIGEENVPKQGPIIVTATHHNMMLDPAILSVAFPHGRTLHYWTKASLFANPVLKYVLESTGNIAVDRKSKDRQLLFKGTIEALSQGHAVALFPEGTSYTEPRIMQVKDGAAWAALEYTRWVHQNPGKSGDGKSVAIIPVCIVYTNKSKYRSDVIMEFGRPISMEGYEEEFLSDTEGASRTAVKRLTHAIETKLLEATINAPDWDTLYAARMARELLWERGKPINLDEFVAISQTLVDLFAAADTTPNVMTVRRTLLEYYSLLQSTHMTNKDLSSLPLPKTLDPHHPAPLPSRLLTLSILIRDTLAILIRLPFFLLPFIIHMPIYFMGRLGASLVEHEEETQAQNKVVVGLLLLSLIYPATFWLLWALLWYTSTGALISAGIVWLFAFYHNKLINDNYERLKRVVAAWRVLIGIWSPKKWDLSLASLSQYTTPQIPPENPWIDKNKASTQGSPAQEPPVQIPQRPRPASGRIMRHVLRARIEAAKALASFFDQLDSPDNHTPVDASVHLARIYGWIEERDIKADADMSECAADEGPRGRRDPKEVIAFLRKRGAKIISLEHRNEADWSALNSDLDSTVNEDSDAGGEMEGNAMQTPSGQRA